MVSLIELSKETVLNAIRTTQPEQTWRCCVVDQQAYKILSNVLEDHHILDERVSEIAKLEEKRAPQSIEALYILTPEEFTVKCLISDYARPKPRYIGAHLLWTAELSQSLRNMILQSPACQFIRSERSLNINFFARESHLFTFRDPSSVYSLYHPECRDLVMPHIKDLARKICCVCIQLGEYPIIRFFRPPGTQLHEARKLSEILAMNVQEQLDAHAARDKNFPPQTNRPRGVLFVVDRSMDLFAPFLHEFTYQAMAHDLLPIKDGDKVTYKIEITNNAGVTEEKEMVINEADTVWVSNRHTHMKDTILRLQADFDAFKQEHKEFIDEDAGNNLDAIRTMMANLPQFQGQRDMYSLHLTMAQECMACFQKMKLPEVALLEQALATGLDENGKVPRNPAESLIRLLDDPSLGPAERLRLITIYMLWKDGLLEGDIRKLILHSQLRAKDEHVLRSLSLFGAKVNRALKEPSRKPPPKQTAPPDEDDDGSSDFSRFQTALKGMLDDHVKGQLDPELFPYTQPQMMHAAPEMASPQASLRSAKPTWSKNRLSHVEPRQRVIVFVAGGATYSEARACYETAKSSLRDVFLGSSHMLTPNLWLTQLANLKESRAALRLPADQPARDVPAALLEPDPVPKPVAPPPQQRPPVQQQPVRRQEEVRPPVKEMGGLKVHHQKKVPYYEEEKKKKKKKFGGIFS